MPPDQQQPQGPSGQPPKKGFLPRNPFLIIAMILGTIILIQVLFGDEERANIPYSQLEAFVMGMPVKDVRFLPTGNAAKGPEAGPEEATDLGLVESVTVIGTDLQGVLTDLDPDVIAKNTWTLSSDGKLKFSCKLPLDWELSRERFLSRGIKIEVKERQDFSVIFLWALPILFLVFMLMMMFRSSRMTGENVLSFGRSRAKIVGENKTGVTFDDVAGADEPKEELLEIVEFLSEPERFTALGGKIPRGCLLVGPPGCGKTLLARAVAGEAGVPFFSISGSDFVEMFVGVGAARVRDLFNTAKQKAPCIVFVDEIDAVGRHRGTGLGGGHDEREQTLNQLLVEMDGFDGRKGVIVVAATNRPDILDPALLRPGRFDRHVILDAPDLKGREEILHIHSRDKPLADSVDLHEMAQRTPGFSGADLANVMNEAALLAARRRRTDISKKETQEAIERVVAGPERRSRIIESREKEILAYHEIGHALVARFSEGGGTVHKVSIIPRGKGLGYTLTLPDEDRYIVTKDELLSRIRMTLGGRAAEEVVFDHQSTGAADDLEKLSDLARSLVCRWGMTDALGPISYDTGGASPFLGREMTRTDHMSEQTAAQIDSQIRQIVDQCHKEATEILTANRNLMDELAKLLIETETLDRVEFEEAVQKYATTAPPPLKSPLKPRDDEPEGDTERSFRPEENPDRAPDASGGKFPPPEPMGA